MGAFHSPQIVFERSCEARPLPLGRPTAAARAGTRVLAPARVRYDLAQKMRSHVRRTFALVEEFRAQHEPALLGAIVQTAGATFDLAEKLRAEDSKSAAERLNCLRDLEHLLVTLQAESRLPAYDLAHAMDGLIVHLVQLM